MADEKKPTVGMLRKNPAESDGKTIEGTTNETESKSTAADLIPPTGEDANRTDGPRDESEVAKEEADQTVVTGGAVEQTASDVKAIADSPDPAVLAAAGLSNFRIGDTDGAYAEEAYVGKAAFAESAVDDVVAVVPVRKQRSIMPGDEADEDSTPAEKQVFQAYKHKQVARFSVGQFNFYDHLLLVYSDDENEKFLDLWEGLETRDRISIVKYDYEAARRAETAVTHESRAKTGLAQTSNFRDPKRIG